MRPTTAINPKSSRLHGVPNMSDLGNNSLKHNTKPKIKSKINKLAGNFDA